MRTEFWQRAFDLPELSVSSGHRFFSSTGWYVERNQSFVYAYFDQVGGNQVFASHPTLQDILKQQIQCLPVMDPSTFLSLSWPSFWDVEFHDIDHFLPEPSALAFVSPPAWISLCYVSQDAEEDVDSFLMRLSGGDCDSLDFEPGETPAIAAWCDGEIVGMARYYEISLSHSLADLSVAVLPTARGQGIGTALVSALSARALERGLVPRFRVGAEQPGSLAVARKLGFLPTDQFVVMNVKADDSTSQTV
jgi:GNAT superfamily N-acetyltransferase